jgi:site-specific DNA-methyltransferase (adenine-specific)
MPKIKREEIIGDCRLLLGDCLEIMPTLGKVDAVVTDPPYGTTACKWDEIIPLTDMWKCLDSITKKNSAIMFFSSQPFSSMLVYSNLVKFKYSLVWCKSQSTGHLNAWKMPMRGHEDILLFCDGQSTYNPQLKKKPIYNQRPISKRTKKTDCYGEHGLDKHKCPQDMAMPNSLLFFNNEQKTEHPTQKPLSLLSYIIKTYTEPHEKVLDFTMGSGTTGVACVNLGRKFIGIELEEKYFDIACKRIDQATRQGKLFTPPKPKPEQQKLI